MTRIALDEAKARFDELSDSVSRPADVAVAEKGEEVLIAKEDGTLFQFVRLEKRQPRPVAGSGKGWFVVADDFDEPLELEGVNDDNGST